MDFPASEETAQKEDNHSIEVVSEEEFKDNVREIVSRDFFQLEPVKEPVLAIDKNGKRMRLNEYLNTHVSEDQASFDAAMKTQAVQHLSRFSNKKSFLRDDAEIEDQKLLEDAQIKSHSTAQGHVPEINLQAIHFQVPNEKTLSRRRILKPEDRKKHQFDLVSLTSNKTKVEKSTTATWRTSSTAASARRELSAPAISLVEKLRSARKKHHS